MDKLQISLEYCYGIKKLNASFDFTATDSVFSVYAPNGVMKTSFANAFKDLSSGKASQDRIRPDNDTVRTIQDEKGKELKPESIFVIEPYNQGYRSDRISALLTNDNLRQQYADIHNDIDRKADDLARELKSYTGLKREILEEFSEAITHDRNDIYRAFGRIFQEVQQDDVSPLAEVMYSHIFNGKTEAILADQDFRNNVKQYIMTYDELINKSTFFKKGVFTHNNAADIAKSLKQNGFFKADHSVYLRVNGQKKEIATESELERAIQSEKDQILTDNKLKESFENIDKLLTKNIDLKQFRTCLENHQIVIAELDNPDKLKQELWVSYFKRSKAKFNSLMETYNKGKTIISEIIKKAKNDVTQWAEVINIFNERFSVPFVVRIDNQQDVILRSDAPIIRFDFLDDLEDQNSSSVPVEENQLLKVLSNGEKRALYILNIIFEVEARKKLSQETLFVVDDIADSFDYKNKYAIIEYLKDIAEESIFQLIILSHNFDFHRTVSSRLDLKRSRRKLVTKVNSQIFIEEEQYQKSPFNHWRRNFNSNEMLIASIPFLRNLAEFSGDDESYKKLTSLLHIKPDTQKFLVRDLQNLIKSTLRDQSNLILENQYTTVKALTYEVAQSIANDNTETAELERKIVLSIAIRLKIEEYMVSKINDSNFWENITCNQTMQLSRRFKEDFRNEREKIQLIDRVNLMTPENIHLNSFMYEPILDLSACHLKNLYLTVDNL
ncbi:MAG: hypothetical protein OXF73_09880 [Gammaproteobacteria bacterium]|nr:hypothetical protein [Gammaproteobacteria bacterium]